jgi:hypothetical protein
MTSLKTSFTVVLEATLDEGIVSWTRATYLGIPGVYHVIGVAVARKVSGTTPPTLSSLGS